MAIGFRASSHVASQTTTSLALTAPSGTQSTDVLVASILWDNEFGNTITAPSGWTVIDTQANTGDLGVWTGWALGSVASLTWTFSGSVINEGSVCGYTGVDNTTPVAAHSLNLVAATNPLSTTAITVPANGWFYGAWFDFNGGTTTWSTPSGLTAREVFSAMGAFDSNGILSGSVTKTSTASPGSATRDAAQAVALAVAAGAAVSMPPMPQAVRRRLLRVQARARLPIAAPDLVPAPVRLRRYLIPTAHSRVQMVPAPITTAPPPSSYVPPIPQHRKIIRPPRSRIVAAPVAPPNPPLPVVRRRVIIPVVHSRIVMVPAPITTAPAQSVYITSFRRQRYLIFTAHSRVQMVPAPITVAPVTTVTVVPPGIRKRHTPMYWYRWLWSTLLEEWPASE